MTQTLAQLRALPPAVAIKPPRLPNGHTFEESTVDEWQSWWRLGYASNWSVSAQFEARELLSLIDAYAKSEDPGRQIRLASAIRTGRRSLGLFEPSPLQDEYTATLPAAGGATKP